MKTELSVLALAALLCAGTNLNAQTSEVPADAPARTDAITRSISVSDLGFSDGLEFQQLAGETTLYFPVPYAAPVMGGTIRIKVEHGATSDVERYLLLSAGNRFTKTQALAPEGGKLAIEIPVTQEDIRNGFLQVGLKYSGAYSDRVCVDERSSGDYLVIEPDSALTLTLDAAAMRSPATVAGLMPRDVRLRFAEESPANIAAAFNAATVFNAEAGHLHFGDPAERPQDATDWTTADIVISASEFGGASEIGVLRETSFPGLIISGTDPQVGLDQLSSIWMGIAGPETAQTNQVGTIAGDPDALGLATLDAGMSAQFVASNSTFEFPFRVSDIPAGRRIASLDLIAASALDPEGRGATLTAYLNDAILGSRPLNSGDLERIAFDVPDGLVSRDNVLRILVQRQPTGGSCTYKVQGYPAQILPGSKFDLVADRDTTDDFFVLSQQFSDGADLVVDTNLGMTQDDILRWSAGIAGSVLPDGSRVSLKGSIAALDGTTPFIVISKSSPAGADSEITLDEGAVEIRDSAGNLLFNGQDLDRLGIVQIVDLNGAKGLWIRPGSGPAPMLSDRNPLVLDRGNLALIDESGVVVATSTKRSDLLTVVYPDRTNVMQILAKYRPWIVGGFWAVLTLLMLGVFQRLYRSRRSPKQTD
ncbi:cellulose biosynthesis cyclic di-GMP-binding regulatory protein BcsB [Puniceibacterium sp. IMCC21224]|uniref:cellulose biosynthesis cyclic di-GMP-binding regulatory protein BcsB n=1 Tax=Puniceibacterium sp. IMCC21224 TaxID=1618204 RepID=UPI00065D809C|nr:cellulose biosynthesis cyclic di-GMP-binding regulatory protein BcsB [Puniceibacterium sp. IMCC21224]KMK64956.1 Bacterial cellulose synthase subunit [Puniceibacterium sp. IMCC21224]